MLVKRIGEQANTYLKEDCRDPKKRDYFTKDYCTKVLKITKADDMRAYIEQVLQYDLGFLDHPINDVVAPMAPGGSTTVHVMSPIREWVEDYKSIRSLRVAPKEAAPGSFISWITIILIPAGLALRTVKTSIELFLL